MECSICNKTFSFDSKLKEHLETNSHKLNEYEVLKNQNKEFKKKLEKANFEKERDEIEYAKRQERERILFNQQLEKSNFEYAKKQERERILFGQQLEKSNFEREHDKIKLQKQLDETNEKLRIINLENKRLRERNISVNSISLSSDKQISINDISQKSDLQNISKISKMEQCDSFNFSISMLTKNNESNMNMSSSICCEDKSINNTKEGCKDKTSDNNEVYIFKQSKSKETNNILKPLCDIINDDTADKTEKLYSEIFQFNSFQEHTKTLKLRKKKCIKQFERNKLKLNRVKRRIKLKKCEPTILKYSKNTFKDIINVYKESFESIERSELQNLVNKFSTNYFQNMSKVVGAITFTERKYNEYIYLDLLLIGVAGNNKNKGYGKALINKLKSENQRIMVWADKFSGCIEFYLKCKFKILEIPSNHKDFIYYSNKSEFMVHGFSQYDLRKLNLELKLV
jgi:hypothetical protein